MVKVVLPDIITFFHIESNDNIGYLHSCNKPLNNPNPQSPRANKSSETTNETNTNKYLNGQDLRRRRIERTFRSRRESAAAAAGQECSSSQWRFGKFPPN